MTYFQNSSRIVPFGRGGQSLTSKIEPLTDEQLMQVAPSIFATEAHSSRSEKFGYVPTIDVLNGLRREGFEPFSVKQGGSKDIEKRGYTKHMIRLRHRGEVARQVGDSIPEVVLLNAHDGTSSYQLMYGWFRLVCLNGMVVADTAKGSSGIKVSHFGDVVGKVIEGSYKVIEEVETQAARVETMKQLTLSNDEQLAFARAALTLRFDDAVPVELEPSRVIQPNRVEDRGNDLWRTFNRAQENLTKGGLNYTTRDDRGRPTYRHTRPVHGVDGDVKLNRAMWQLAEEMGRLKAA